MSRNTSLGEAKQTLPQHLTLHMRRRSSILDNMLIETDELNECIFLAGHIRRAFDSRIRTQLLLAARKRGGDRLVILPFRNMYSKLSNRVKVPSRSGQIILRNSVPMRKGIRQGTISSPLLYNNSVPKSQNSVKISFIFRGMDLSLLNYTDDILNTSRCLSRIVENFGILSTAYKQIGFAFNTTQSVYLGMPIGSNRVFTRALQINRFGEKMKVAYGILSPRKKNITSISFCSI